MGEGQFKLQDGAVDELNHLDADLEAAVDSRDEDAFHPALHKLLERARELSVALPADAIEPSDLILPGEGATIEEVHDLLSNDGLIPG